MIHEVITPSLHKKIRQQYPKFKTKKIWKNQTDAVIIGSGAGGAVAAAELAQAGWKVILIEEGSYFQAGDFHDDEFLSNARLYRDGGSITSEDLSLNILQGRSLGGSTTVNWQTCLYPPDYITQEWSEHFGLIGYEAKNMQPYIHEVRKKIHAHPVPSHLINPNNKVLLNGAKKLNLLPELLENNNRGCIGLGRCGLGCPINAKQSMFLTYIPDALNNGATVITNMRAVQIIDGKRKKVYAEFCPEPHRKEVTDAFEGMEIQASIVIVSAGAIEGPALLQRSGLGNSWVGRNLKVHPTAAVMALFKKEIHMYSGPPQSIMIKDGHNQKGSGYGFWLEAAPARPQAAASGLPLYGKDNFAMMKNYTRMHAGIALVRDGADGQTKGKIEWSWGQRKVHYELSPTDGKHLLLGIQLLAQIQKSAGAIQLVFPFLDEIKPHILKKGRKSSQNDFAWVLQKSFAPGTLKLYSAHPHGSIQAAISPKNGAIDPHFALYGHTNIFVMDASWYPTGLSVNPQLATMSSVLRASRRLAQIGAKAFQ